jgi:FixJ family two-component response regulator
MAVDGTILVVDDDPGFRKGIVRLLKAKGFRVRSFSSAEELQADGGLDHAACLILDIHLGGISGIELQHQQRRSGSKVPVIFVTGRGDDATEAAALAVGCVAYLEKPCAAKALMDAVSIALRPGRSEHIA